MKTFHSLTNAAFILIYFFFYTCLCCINFQSSLHGVKTPTLTSRQSTASINSLSFFHHGNFPEFFPPLKIFHLTCITKKFPINLLPSTVYHHRFSPTSKTPAFLCTGLHTVHTLQAPVPPRLTTLSHVNIRCIDKQVTSKVIISNRDE